MAANLQWRQSWNGTVLAWTETWGEGAGALSVTAAATLTGAGSAVQGGAFGFAATASFAALNSSYAASAVNLAGSTTVLVEGTTLGQPAALSIQPAAGVTFLSATGSAFLIQDDQTTMQPAAGAVANSVVIAVSSAVPLWVGSDVQDFRTFSIAATATLTPAASPLGNAEFAATGAVSVAFAATPFYGTDLLITGSVPGPSWQSVIVNPRGVSFPAASTVIFGPYSRASGAFGVAAQGSLEFGQTAGAVSQGAYLVSATSAVTFGATSRADAAVGISALLSAEFGQPGGGVEFGALSLAKQLTLNFGAESAANGSLRVAATSHFEFSSTEFVEVDDDLKSDADPSIFWQAAAQQEAWERDRRRLRRIARIDEDDLLTLSAALAQALSQATGGGIHA